MPAAPSDIKLICFDLGGVVLRICSTWAEGCAAAGLDVRGNVEKQLARAGGWDMINDGYQRGQITGIEYAQNFSTLLDGLYTPDEITAIHDAWTRGEYPGIADTVKRISAAGLTTAVLSNTSHEHWITFPQYDVFSLFDHRHASHLLGLRKPEEAIYRALEEHTGFAGTEIVFFDDLPENVAAARDIGWNAHQINPRNATPPQIEWVLSELGVFT